MNQLSSLFWLDEDGFVTISQRLSLAARDRTSGNFDHQSVMDVLYDLEGGDIAYEYEIAATEMVDTINALSRADAEEAYNKLDADTILHLYPLGLSPSVDAMEVRGLFSLRPPKWRYRAALQS